MADVIRTPDGDIRISGKVKHANVTFTEIDAEYESEVVSASGEVTHEELEHALDVVSRWSASSKPPRQQRA